MVVSFLCDQLCINDLGRSKDSDHVKTNLVHKLYLSEEFWVSQP